jgi:DNA-binding PadR family transcriptional regulator
MPRLLTDFELMIVLAVLRLPENAYGLPIAREIEDRTGRRVLLAAVYAALDRLERQRLLSSSMGTPTPERGGRAKRFFKVTAGGVQAVQQTRRALESLWEGVPQLRSRRT